MITIEFTDDGGGEELLHPPPSLSTPLMNNSFIYKFGLGVWLFVCLFVCFFVSNKRQNGWTDWAQIFCGTSRDPREGFKNLPPSKFDFWKFWNSTNFFFEIPRNFLFLFFVNKENPQLFFSKDGREFLVI